MGTLTAGKSAALDRSECIAKGSEEGTTTGLERIVGKTSKPAEFSGAWRSERDEAIAAALYSKQLADDRLILSDILKVIDGVLDAPERIGTLTSNYPERINNALLRPGRI